jgi:hypothetical protein
MKAFAIAAASGFALVAAPLFAQDDDMSEVIVTGSRRNSISSDSITIRPPVIGLRRQADSAVREIEITSDSLDEGLRRREVEAMLLATIDRAKASGIELVTGQFELTALTRENWKDQFPGLAGKPKSDAEEDDEDDYDDGDDAPTASYEDDGDSTTIRLKLKTKLDGSIGGAHEKITRFVKSVPATGRSEIKQVGSLALTIVNPAQYRDQIYTLIAAGAKHAQSFYGPEYGLDVTGLDQDLAWKQVSNTEVFLYLPYSFTVRTR